MNIHEAVKIAIEAISASGSENKPNKEKILSVFLYIHEHWKEGIDFIFAERERSNDLVYIKKLIGLLQICPDRYLYTHPLTGR